MASCHPVPQLLPRGAEALLGPAALFLALPVVSALPLRTPLPSPLPPDTRVWCSVRYSLQHPCEVAAGLCLSRSRDRWRRPIQGSQLSHHLERPCALPDSWALHLCSVCLSTAPVCLSAAQRGEVTSQGHTAPGASCSGPSTPTPTPSGSGPETDALLGDPGPPQTGWGWGLGVRWPRGLAAVLEACLPQNSQIVKNNSGGFCLAFALEDVFSFCREL